MAIIPTDVTEHEPPVIACNVTSIHNGVPIAKPVTYPIGVTGAKEFAAGANQPTATDATVPVAAAPFTGVAPVPVLIAIKQPSFAVVWFNCAGTDIRTFPDEAGVIDPASPIMMGAAVLLVPVGAAGVENVRAALNCGLG